MTYELSTHTWAAWRTHPTSVDFYCFIHTPPIVFMAQVNMPIGIGYPIPFLLYDNVIIGDYTSIEEDMLLLLGTTPGGDDLGRVRTRLSATADFVADPTKIEFHYASQGAFDGEIDLQDNAYITILDAHWLWSIPPNIDANGLILEDFDSLFTENKHLLPVAPAGVDFLEVLDSPGSTVQKTFGENAAYATADGATIASTSWTFPDGQTSSSATPTITFTAPTIGYYKLSVEDSLGNVKTSWRLMAVVDKNHPSLIRDWEINNHAARWDGQEMSITIHDPLPFPQYINGTEVLIAMREKRGDSTGALVGATGFENMVFAGFLDEEQFQGDATPEGYQTETTFVLLDNAGKLKTLPGFTEVKERESSPTTWAHMKGANIDRYVASILDHRSNALRRMDFIWSGTGDTYAFTILGSDGANLYEQADQRCQAIAYKLTCDRYGRLFMRPIPLLQAEADKTTAVIAPISELDWSSVRRTYRRAPQVHWNWGECIAVSTNDASSGQPIQTFWNLSPGLAPGQGLSSQTSGEQLAASQDELNVRERKRYEALLNDQYGNLEVLLSNDGYFCDPSLLRWVQFEITSQHSGVRGRSFVGSTRFLPIEMNYRYDHANGIREQRITIQKEVVTTRKAVTYVPAAQPGFDVPTLPVYPPPAIQPQLPLGSLLAGTYRLGLFMWRDFSAKTWSYYRTLNGSNYTETTKATLGASGQYLGFQQDPYSPDRGWVLTDEQIGLISGLSGTPSYSVQTDLDLAVGDAVQWAYIHTNIAAPNFVAVSLYALNGGTVKHYLITTPDGSNWTTSLLSNNVGGILWLSAHLAGYVHLVDYELVSGSNYNVRYRRSTDYGVNFSTITQLPKYTTALRTVHGWHFPYANNSDDGFFYFSQRLADAIEHTSFLEYDAGSVENLDALVPNTTSGDAQIGGIGLRGIDTYSGDRNILAMVGQRFNYTLPTGWTTDNVAGGYVYSSDGAGSFLPASSVTTTLYRGIAVTNDDPNTRIIWGADGTLEKTVDGVTFEDISGDLPGTGTDVMDNAIDIVVGV